MHLFFLMEIITNLFSRDSKQLEATTFLLFPPPSSLSLHIPLRPSIILRYAYLKKLVTTWLKKIHLVFTGFHNLASFHNINCTHMCYGAFFFFPFYRWHIELGPVIQPSFCIKPDSSLTGTMYHLIALRKMLCCVYMCLPSSWFLNMGTDAWHVLEFGIGLLLWDPNEANCISYKTTLPSFLFSFCLLSTFSSLVSSSFPPFFPLTFSSFAHIFLFLSY